MNQTRHHVHLFWPLSTTCLRRIKRAVAGNHDEEHDAKSLKNIPFAPFVASLLLVVRPGAPSSFLLLVAMPLLLT